MDPALKLLLDLDGPVRPLATGAAEPRGGMQPTPPVGHPVAS